MVSKADKIEGCGRVAKAKRPAVPLPVLDPSAPVKGTVRKSRMGRRRAAVLIAVYLLMIGHVVHWLVAGRTVSPVEPSESMYTLTRGELNAGFVFFAASLLATLILGRWVCGWGCHIVALQDLCGWIMKKLGVRPKPFRARLLMFVPLGAALYMFVWPTVHRLLWPTPENAFPGFSNHFVTTEFWKTFPGVAVAVPFLLICGFATVYFLGSKGYCTYACPYGGFFGLADKFAMGRIRVTDACDGCGHCTANCTSNVKVHAEVRDYGMVVDPGCMKCLDCVSVCPMDALYYGFGRPSLVGRPRTERPAKTRFDLSWSEEIILLMVFLIALLCVRGVYGVVPFLMALGMAGVVTYGVWKLSLLWRRPGVALQNLRLKSGGRITFSGWTFAACAVLVLVLVTHSGFIQYHKWQGDRYYDLTYADEEAVLSGTVPPLASTDPLRRTAFRAIRHLSFCHEWGLLDTSDTHMKLAWLSLVLGNRGRAVRHLRKAGEIAPDLWQVDYYVGSVLLTAGQLQEALYSLERAVEKHPGDAGGQFKLGNALARLGRFDEAIIAWRALLEREPGFAAARHNLAGALRQLGRTEEAVIEYERALRDNPQDAETHFELGVTYTQTGRAESASEHFRRAVQLDPRYKRFFE